MIRARQLGLMTPLLEAVLSKVTRKGDERSSDRSAASPAIMRLMNAISRRRLLLSLPGLALAPRLAPRCSRRRRAAAPRARSINHIGLAVSDPKRSIDFYQGLFGMPVRGAAGRDDAAAARAPARSSSRSRRWPAAPRRASRTTASASRASTSIACMAALAAHGVTKADAVGPMKALVAMRGPDMNGAKEGTPELNFGDPDGIVCQLQDASYCGGAGPLGNVCGAPEPLAEERAARAARPQPPHDLFDRLAAHRTSSIRISAASRSARIRARPRRRSPSVRRCSS